MSEESASWDLVEVSRRAYDAVNRRDFDTVMKFWADDGVWDLSPYGLGVYEGRPAVRRFFEDWMGAYEEFTFEVEEILDLGNGISFAVIIQSGRPAGSSGEVRVRYGAVTERAAGLIVHVRNYPDVDDARAAAERLAEERG